MSGDVTSTLAEEGVVGGRIGWDPAFLDEGGTESGDEFDVFGCVGEEVGWEGTFEPKGRLVGLVHFRDFRCGVNVDELQWTVKRR